MLNRNSKKLNTLGIINVIKHFFLGNIVIYEALGQVKLPLDLSFLRQSHLPSGCINHDIAQKEMFYSVNNNFITRQFDRFDHTKYI